MRIALGLIFVIALHACTSRKNTADNTITFKAPYQAVEDTMQMMNGYMDSLLVPPTDNYSRYYFDNGNNLIINRAVLGKRGTVNPDTVSCMKNLSAIGRRQFVSGIYFMKDNFMMAAYKDDAGKQYLYHYVPDSMLYTDRSIFLQEEGKDYSALFKTNISKDRKGKLTLLSRRQ